MNDFYEYLAALVPDAAIQTSKHQRKSCVRAVLRRIRKSEKPRVRIPFRIALIAAAALALTAMVPAGISAARNHGRNHYEFTPIQPEQEVQQHLDTLAPILQTETQSYSAAGFTLTLTAYATDGLNGSAFFELTVPNGFDWKHPRLTSEGTVYQDSVKEEGSVWVGGGFSSTDDTNVYRCEARLNLNDFRTQKHNMAAPPQRELRLQEITLYDENVHLHTVTIHADFRLTFKPNEYCIITKDERFGEKRLTPFGVYFYSFDNTDTARNYDKVSGKNPVQVTMKDGTVFTPDNCMMSMAEAEVRSDVPNYGTMNLVFPYPVRLSDVTEIKTLP